MNTTRVKQLLVGVGSLYLAACGRPDLPAPESGAALLTEWPAYGGDAGGQRFATDSLLTPENVSELAPAWTYRHGDLSDGRGDIPTTSAFENTPILADGTLYFCTPMNRVIALDPLTGEERWRFDPLIDLSGRYANQLVCRGVSYWRDSEAAEGAACARRIFTATNDARLLAIDAATGRRCADFGEAGEIDLNPDAGEQQWLGEYGVTSPPAIVGNQVIVGSAVSDGQRTDAPSGVIRAFDTRSGTLRWAWDLAPTGFDYAAGPVSRAGYALGTPNVWSPMSVDTGRGLVFVPTGNAATDYFGGERVDMNHYGSSVVALDGETGSVAWHYQLVHNDLWDFDVAAQPTLTRVRVDGNWRDAVVQATKQGLLFTLDRETGRPLRPVQEKPVPQVGAVPEERLSPTQPFPDIPPLLRTELRPEDAWGLTPYDRGACRDQIASLLFEGMYTPPSLQGTLMYPGNAGGTNWGGIAVHPRRQLAVVRSTDLPWAVTLFPAEQFRAMRAAYPGEEVSPQAGTPYGMYRRMLLSPFGLPCNAPPWGTLSAVDLERGRILWQVPHGSIRDLAPVPLPLEWGVPGTGGPLVTDTGVIFIGGAMDNYLRAYALDSGEELWRARMPAGVQATPMTFTATLENGTRRQYVVIAAGGHGRAGTTLGDYLVAFAIEQP